MLLVSVGSGGRFRWRRLLAVDLRRGRPWLLLFFGITSRPWDRAYAERGRGSPIPLRCMRPSRRAILRHEPSQPLVPLLPCSFIRLSAGFAAKLTSHECVSNQSEFGAALLA